jgi:predicted DNA-binding transcriptional regulator YafY
MNRLDRLTAILIHLQSKRVVKAQELANRFSISLRTVYRDMRSLEEAGVPIGAEAGVGYFLENYHLPPVMFTNAEASALVFGGKFVEKMTDASLREPFESALFKIKSVLKRTDKDHLDDLAPVVDVAGRPRPAPFSDHLLNAIQAALVGGQVLALSYRAGYADSVTQREVEPIGLCHYGAAWHLIAFCRLRQDYRDFRVDRIQELQPTGLCFARQSLLSLERYLANLQQAEQLEEVVVWFERQAARFALEQRYSFGFVGESEDGERVRMQFVTQSLEGLGWWLLMYGNAVTIEKPARLRELLRARACELMAHYGG